MKLFFLVVFAIFLPIESAVSQIHKSDDQVKNKSKKSLQELDDKHKVPFHGSMFSPNSIPSADIPVLANSLGDVVYDSVVNVLDLLRLRDITIGRPPSPTSYELDESDLNFDGNVNLTDLGLIRDILLRKRGVPYLIDETGGNVFGNGITLTIPPGGVDETVVMSIKRNSESEFSSKWGVDTKAAAEDSAYFMSSFEIKSSTADFKLPVGASIKLDSIPPCAYEGLNGLFATVPDRDGDGLADLFLINELEVAGDSLTLNAADIPVPTIQSLSASQIEPGQPLIITGHGFGKYIESILLNFKSTNTDFSQNYDPWFVDDSTIIATVPNLTPGQCTVTVHNILTGLISNPQVIDVLPYGSISGDIRSIIVNFYIEMAAAMDSLNTDSLFITIEDNTVRNYAVSQSQSNRASIDTSIAFFTALDDSIMDEFQSLAAFIQNLTSGSETFKRSFFGQTIRAGECPCDIWIEAYHRKYLQILMEEVNFWITARNCKPGTAWGCAWCKQAEKIRKILLKLLREMLFTLAQMENCKCDDPANCGEDPDICEKCEKTVFIGYSGNTGIASGGYDDDGNFDTDGVCINIIRYRRNQCMKFAHIPDEHNIPLVQPDTLKCDSADPRRRFMATELTEVYPHPGSIIKATNAPTVYNIVGILNNNGQAFIPFVPLNTQVTYSLYDPTTGLYDPDVGTYTTGLEPGGFDRPILLFQPNSEIRTKTLRIGEPSEDFVLLDMQRIDYHLNIEATDTSKLFNIGFSASAHLSLKIDDPEGSMLYDNTDLACILIPQFRFTKVGKYQIRVALGMSTQPGSFELGVDYSPDPPIASSCLCGTVLDDTLFVEFSPYTVNCLADIPINDTLTVKEGVTLQFEEGGTVTATGILSGVGTSERPIKLKQVGAPQQENVAVKKPVYGTKEVQP